MSGPTRPVLRWHGGKWKLAKRIMKFFPRHRTYVEPYGGAASVLLRKERSYAEVYNDLDDQVVGLFRILQHPAQSARLVELLRLTPFARAEFERAYEPCDEPIESARRLLIRSYMGFGSNTHASTSKGHRSTGFRANSNRSGTTPARDWFNYPDCLIEIIERWRGVIIERRPALEVIAQHDGPGTLIYADPPYVHDTRSAGAVNHFDVKYRMYRHEMSDADHQELLDALDQVEGMVVLSGYASPLYDDRLAGWGRFEIPAYADGARERLEIVWCNPAAVDALERQRGDLFAAVAEGLCAEP